MIFVFWKAGLNVTSQRINHGKNADNVLLKVQYILYFYFLFLLCGGKSEGEIMFFEVETRALLEVFKVYLIFSVFVWQAQSS